MQKLRKKLAPKTIKDTINVLSMVLNEAVRDEHIRENPCRSVQAMKEEFIQNGIDGFKKNPEEAKRSRYEKIIGRQQLEIELLKKRTILYEKAERIHNRNGNGEGYKKIHTRLNKRMIYVGKERVLRIMKHNNLLSPLRIKHNGSSRPHDGTIITNTLNQMWGTDGKQFTTVEEGKCWFFSVIDHCNNEILGYHICKKGNRYAALEPIHQAIKKEFGHLEKQVCKELQLSLRLDHGTQYSSHDFRNEMNYLGLKLSPSFVRSPECNGMIERFHRTLQEEVLQCYTFKNLEEARQIIGEFIERYNSEWILHRLNFRTPKEHRKYLTQQIELTQKNIA